MKTTAPTLITDVKSSLHICFPWHAVVLVWSFCAFFNLNTSAQRTYTLYNETIGSYAGSISVTAYTGWSNGTRYMHTVPSGTASVNNLIIPSNYPGASGGTPVTVPAGSTWVISGINTSAFSAINLSFGIHKSNVRTSGADMNIEVSSDGITYTTLAWPLMPTVNGSGDTWHYKEGGTAVTGTIPATPNLRIRFRNASSSPYDFDDIHLKGTSALPLQLLSFTATRGSVGYNLAWTTNGETDVAHFLVQGSNDGILFYNIQQVGARNSGIEEAYTINDASPRSQSFYYRLCWVDRNGAVKYSSVVKTKQASTQKAALLSNPAAHGIILVRGFENNETIYYSLYNASGQMIKKGITSNAGTAKHMIPTTGLTPGTYFLQVGSNQEKYQFPVVIL